MFPIYQITALSYTAQDLLHTSGRGEVHSVYNKTVNLSCGGELLSLQARDTVSSPLTLETVCSPEELRALQLRPGMSVSFLSDGLYVEDLYFDFFSAQRWEARLSPSSSVSSCELSFLQACLRGILPRGGFSDLTLPEGEVWRSSPYALEAAGVLSSVRLSLDNGDLSLAARQLCSLIGLGEGLTPSGDDFLCGVLAGCSLGNAPSFGLLRRELGDLLPTFWEKTNDVSAGLLRCAVKGLFSRPVLALARGTSLSAAQADFAAIGHSSGADTLNGMIFLLSAL